MTTLLIKAKILFWKCKILWWIDFSNIERLAKRFPNERINIKPDHGLWQFLGILLLENCSAILSLKIWHVGWSSQPKRDLILIRARIKKSAWEYEFYITKNIHLVLAWCIFWGLAKVCTNQKLTNQVNDTHRCKFAHKFTLHNEG